MGTRKFKDWMTVNVIGCAVGATWIIAALTEWRLSEGYVRYIALMLFAGTVVICGVGLAWFLANALIESRQFAEHNRDLVTTGEHDHVYVRSDGKTEFNKLGDLTVKSIVIPAPRKRAMSLDSVGLNSELYELLRGGAYHGDKNIGN